MSVTIADEKLIAELTRSGSPVDLRAADGRILGVFTSAVGRGPEPVISEEELRRLEDATTGKWYAAAEVEAKLWELRRCSP